MGNIYSFFFSEVQPPEDVTDAPNTEDPKPTQSSSVPSVNSRDDLQCKQNENETLSTDTAVTSDCISEVEKKNIHVIYAGKSKEFFIFPLEKISVLLQEACVWAKKKPENMNLVFNGELLEKTKKMCEYPCLRGGCKVNLIHAG